MIKEIKTERLPIKMWVNEIEDGAMEQAKNLANLPFVFKHIALMPDCHQGFGMPIGGVMAAREVIIPNAVGVDIGCGMCAVQTSLKEIDRKTLGELLNNIRLRIPLGFKHHKKPQSHDYMPQDYDIDKLNVVKREYDRATYQLGTLGGGNHFIEIQNGSDGMIWIMVHSGSRNIGKQVADYYNRLAINLNEKWKSPVPRKVQLAYLPLKTDEAQLYIKEMNYCVDFAFANRKLMMKNIIEVFENTFGKDFRTAPVINIAHNYASIEEHFGEKVVVHRKGATYAGEGTTGIIPGSQGANSYIVKGKGNRDIFKSCSHGAGRVMGRKQAIRSLDLKAEIKNLNEKNIIHSIKSQKDLDEAASAYKDIYEVMKLQEDLVEVLLELEPMAVIKG